MDSKHDWEAAARIQAARADHLEELLSKVHETARYVETPEIDALDDRFLCEGCDARGWHADGFVGDAHGAWCPACATPAPAPAPT